MKLKEPKVYAGIVCVLLIAMFYFLIIDGNFDALRNDVLPFKRADLKGNEDLLHLNTLSSLSMDEPVDAGVKDADVEAVKDDLLPQEIVLNGVVIDKNTKEPIARYDLEVKKLTSGFTPWETITHETIEDGGGRFSIPLCEAGKYKVYLRSSRYRPLRHDVEISPDAGIVDIALELDPGAIVSGSVIDARTGRPVRGALIGCCTYQGESSDLSLLTGFTEYLPHTVSDKNGQFRLQGLESKSQFITGNHPEYAQGFVKWVPDETGDIEILLREGSRIHGHAYDDDGNPISNVAIQAWSKNSPFARTVLTDAAGAYRTPPLPAGWIYLDAKLQPDETEGAGMPCFSPEKKCAELKDGDIEVDFGPDDNQLTWQGILYDYDGAPLKGCRIELKHKAEGQNAPDYYLPQSVITDDQASFSIVKLLPAGYEVKVQFPDRTTYVDCGDIRFDETGVVTRDLWIKGGVIHGEVIDSSTGKPFSAKRVSVLALSSLPPYRAYSAKVNESGNFCLRGLPPQTFRLTCNTEGYITENKPSITLKEEQVIHDCILYLSLGGRLQVHLTGFGKEKLYKFCLAAENGKRKYSLSLSGEIGESDRKGEYTIEAGKYAAVLEFRGFETIERPFTIIAGKTTALNIDAAELIPEDGVLSARGKLTYSDGSPLSGAWLGFLGLEGPEIEPFEESLGVTTDSEGRFQVEGLRFGKWKVCTYLVDGGEYDFPDLIIDEKTENPVILNLALNRGAVTGTLINKKTNHPLKEEDGKWWVYMYDADSGKRMYEIQGGHSGSCFKIPGVTMGKYFIIVAAQEFKNYRTEPFFVEEGQQYDLEKLPLDPTGVLDLEVVNQDGHPLKGINVFFNESKLDFQDIQHISPGHFRCFNLPIGSSEIVVRAKGYREKTVSLFLEPGVRGKKQLVLENK